MTETANILHNASERSLVLLDEIGRGTSTFDGLSLAWACADHLTDVGAFTLFATHYFEITQLADERRGICNLHLDATEHNDSIVFLHQVQEGPASKSYGLQVAKLAGISESVLQTARQQLAALEQGSLPTATSAQNSQAAVPAQSDLFSTAPHPAVSLLESLDVDGLSPREALDTLYELREMSKRL